MSLAFDQLFSIQTAFTKLSQHDPAIQPGAVTAVDGEYHL
jgi:hypothetical protein